jgi:hypothetical protein
VGEPLLGGVHGRLRAPVLDGDLARLASSLEHGAAPMTRINGNV